jgi:hypothetical protein
MGKCMKKSWKDIVQTAGGLVLVFIGISLLWVASGHASIGAPTNLEIVPGICEGLLSNGEPFVLFMKSDDESDIAEVATQAGRAMMKDGAEGYYLNCKMKGKTVIVEFTLDQFAVANYCVVSSGHYFKRFSGDTIYDAINQANKLAEQYEAQGAQFVDRDCQGSGFRFRLSLKNDPVFHKITKEEK